MLEFINEKGKFKIPVKAYHARGDEFLIYETDFGREKWEDIYASRLCLLNARPAAGYLQELKEKLYKNGYTNHYLVGLIP